MESKDFMNEMLNVADTMLAIGAAAVPGGPTGKNALQYWYVNSHSVGLNYTRNILDDKNSYQAIGKVVGDTITLVIAGKQVDKIFKSGTTLNLLSNGGTSYVINHYSPLGNYMSSIFDTYVRNADEFYTRLYNDKEYRDKILETTKSLLPKYSELSKYYSEVTLEQFWKDIKDLFGRPPVSGEGSLIYSMKLNTDSHIEITNINQSKKDEIEKSIIQEITKHNSIKQITLNSHTYNIKSLSNLEIRNALDNIPKVSFLLSNILIRAGEEIDLGSRGIYKVKSGDTLSTIAQRNGMVTKDLLKLNTWLVDEGRVSFLQNKVLIESNILNLNETDHVLVGDQNADNILIDSNGGDDVLKGGNKKDILKGGTYDKNKKAYISDDKNKAWGLNLKCA
ncbi:LysM peptidoglycan-binding domain-containing protein [Campylobacter sp. CCUG 57310]|uniref:LysM peptidoglycan-binding domain-containing protein n=1 Tax=Campylobacter sp. CCUG 57310 TaxID=2517362 RepID=UPI001564DB9B|nr:LysM peptidoglycan-binding domain-containing protein [Campylobacter sp. CCUG 57310]QKF92739.1 hypothetical protein CORI_1568 [Campylobacter sp. CCUG 57310]